MGILDDIKNFGDDVAGGINDVGNYIEDRTDFIDEWFLEDVLGIELPELPEPERGVLLTKKGNTQPIPIVYGTRRVGGIRVFVETSGTNNEYLHLVLALCEGEISAINSVWINDEEIVNGDIDGNGDVITGTFANVLRIKKYTGTDAQTADADLVADVTNWTTNHRLRGVAYIYLRAKWDQENRAFGSFPRVMADVDGKLLYDPRDLSTTFSHNNALCLYDYLTNARYGRGLAAADLDAQAFEDAADYCDTLVTPYSGAPGTHKRYACDGVLDTGRKVLDNIKDLLPSLRGRLPFIAGKWTLIIDKDETPVFTFDESNIIGGINISRGGKRARLNRIQGTYANPDEDYQPDIVTQDSATFRTEDNGLLLDKRLNLPYTTNAYRAAALIEMDLKQSRQGITLALRSTIAALVVSAGQVVNVTHSTPGWTNKAFRVKNIELLDGATLGVLLTEHETTVYDLTLPTEAPTQPDTNLPNPNISGLPSSLALYSGTAELIAANDGTIITRIRAEWVAPNDIFVNGYDIEFKKTADSIWTPGANANNGAATESYIVGVEDGVQYDVRIRSHNANDVVSAWVTVTNYAVIGKTAAPSDVTTFLVQRQPDGTREFKWTHTPPVDHAGYKIRYKLGTGHAWADMAALHEGLLTSSPFETNQLAAGTYTAGIKAIDTTGNESANAVIVESTLGDPRIAGSLLTIDPHALGWPGTKTDCFVAEGNLYATDTKDWSDFATDVVDWANWTEWARVPNSPIIYEHDTIDVGVITDFVPLVSVTANGTTILIEEEHSDDDISYSAWATAGVQINARYTNIRVTVTHATELANITQMLIILSADPIEEVIEDLDTSALAACVSSTVCATSGYRIAAGDFRLPVVETYSVIHRINIALQNVGAGWSWEVIDKDVGVGPRIKIYNASGVLADATIDADIKGV